MFKDWELAYQNGATPWDKGYAAPPLAEYLSAHSIKGNVLVPGCGAGHDVRLLAAQGAGVLGLDIAPTALALAESYPPAGSEAYTLGDFLSLPSELCGSFDWLFEHTCLSALSPKCRRKYAQAVSSALKPQGKFLAILFCRTSSDPGEGPPYAISFEEFEQLFKEDFRLLSQSVPLQTYPERPSGSEVLCLMQKL